MKKRVIKIIGIGLLVAAMAVPVVVLAQGGWGGYHMMDQWGRSPGQGTPNDRGYSALTPDQRSQLDQLDRKFYEETADLQKALWEKSSELNALLNAADPDIKRVKALFKEVNNLQSQLDEKNLDYNLEQRKIIPGSRFGGGYGSPQGSHMGGYGSGMMGGGMGSGMMGGGMMGRGYGN
jgi:zinc resistance-associated protein